MDQWIVRLEPGFDNEPARGRKRRLLHQVDIAVCSSIDEIFEAGLRAGPVVDSRVVVAPERSRVDCAERNRHLLKDSVGGSKDARVGSRTIGPKAAGKRLWV